MKPDLHPDFQIHPQHFAEWLDSAVDPDLIRLNVKNLEGSNPLEYLLYALPDTERRNDGRLRDKWLKKYAHTEHGGWWCSGVDILTLAAAEWGCFKPNQPRINHNGKPIKYEHPPKSDTSIFALRVPAHIWDRIAARYGIKRYHSPLTLRLQDRKQPVSFWEWILAHPEIPLVVTEGAKKAGAILTAGYVAIALPGIFNGYRQPKDEWGRVNALPRLIPQLEILARGGRDIYLAFDRDTKPKTIANVRTAIIKTGKLLASHGCAVKVISWSQPEKGVDDLIAARGENALITAYNAAESLETWLTRQSNQLTYPVACRLNKRYLGDFLHEWVDSEDWGDWDEGEELKAVSSPSPLPPLPPHSPYHSLSLPPLSPATARLIGLKSPKGTGKTEWLSTEVEKAIFRGQPVIILTHRVQLGQALCRRFGVPYITEIRDSEIGTTLGYGLCVDSLHRNSLAHFQPENWSDALIIIDECEQVFWHLLNANTEVQKHRVAILRTLKTLIQTALSGEGKIYLSDADLSDVSIDYVRSLAGFPLTPWIVVNEYQNPDDCWDVFTYGGNNPKQLVAALIEDIKTGGVPMVCCSAQKPSSKWGTRNLEAHLSKLFPEKNILRIDSESVANPNHPAYGCIAHLNEILPNYDIVLASPSIETGVSIDIKGHFTGVWDIASGGMPTNSVRQAIARVRDNVPRHIWAAARGMGRIGNGSTSIKNLLASQHKLTQLNIRLLAQSELDDDVDCNFQPESLRTWAKMAARVNLGMSAYRETILAELKAEGHRIMAAQTHKASEIETAVATTRDEQYQQHREAVAVADNPTDAEYQKLKEKRNKTEAELLAERHGNLARRYGIDVSAPLVKKDDRGWYLQLMLHYYLTYGKEFLASRDLRLAKAQLESGQGAIFQPSFNDSQLTAKVRMLEILGIPQLFDSEAKFSSSSELLVKMAQLAKQNAWEIKTVLGLTINQKDTPIAIAQMLLRLLGLKLSYLGRFGSRGARERFYGGVALDDGREKVFEVWLSRDSQQSEVA